MTNEEYIYKLSCGNVTHSGPERTATQTRLEPGAHRLNLEKATSCFTPLHGVNRVIFFSFNLSTVFSFDFTLISLITNISLAPSETKSWYIQVFPLLAVVSVTALLTW